MDRDRYFQYIVDEMTLLKKLTDEEYKFLYRQLDIYTRAKRSAPLHEYMDALEQLYEHDRERYNAHYKWILATKLFRTVPFVWSIMEDDYIRILRRIRTRHVPTGVDRHRLLIYLNILARDLPRHYSLLHLWYMELIYLRHYANDSRDDRNTYRECLRAIPAKQNGLLSHYHAKEGGVCPDYGEKLPCSLSLDRTTNYVNKRRLCACADYRSLAIDHYEIHHGKKDEPHIIARNSFLDACKRCDDIIKGRYIPPTLPKRHGKATKSSSLSDFISAPTKKKTKKSRK